MNQLALCQKMESSPCNNLSYCRLRQHLSPMIKHPPQPQQTQVNPTSLSRVNLRKKRVVVPRCCYSSSATASNRRRGVVAKSCIAGGESRCSIISEVELERELEEVVEEGKGWKEMEKCRGAAAGMVELLECLEKEAITGVDEGKDPGDYNRRAQIFDKSSKVFQALNNLHHHKTP